MFSLDKRQLEKTCLVLKGFLQNGTKRNPIEIRQLSTGLGNHGNTRSKLSLKCATMLEIGRPANRGSCPSLIIGLSFWPVSTDSIDLFSDAFGPRGEKLNGKQTKFSGKNSPN